MTMRGRTLSQDEIDTQLLRTQFMGGASLEQLALYFAVSTEVVLAVLRGEQTIHGNPVRIDDGLQARIERRLAA